MGIRDILRESYNSSSLLKAIYDTAVINSENRNIVISELVRLHNENCIDIVNEFKLLSNEPSVGMDFFFMRQIFEEVLIGIEAPISEVMDCVISLYREAGNDFAAGSVIDAYISFCTIDSNRPIVALNEIFNNPKPFLILLTPTLIAGSKIDKDTYLSKTVELCNYDHQEFKGKAIFAISKINWTGNPELLESALSELEKSSENETEEKVVASIMKSSFSLYKQDNSMEKRVNNLVEKLIKNDKEKNYYAASELFCNEIEELPNSLVNILIDYFAQYKQSCSHSLRNLDYGISRLLKKGIHNDKALNLLQDLLLVSPRETTINEFGITARVICDDRNLHSKVLTRWFLNGNPYLCKAIQSISSFHHGEEKLIEIDPAELDITDSSSVIFIARKSIGYLFQTPISATSALISLIRNSSNSKTKEMLKDLLFDPMLINYPGKVKEYLMKLSDIEVGEVKKVVDQALVKIEQYLEDLRTVGKLNALHPSKAQQEGYYRHFAQLMGKSLKEAERKSVFLHLVSKNVILYGRKWINYCYNSEGEACRSEAPLLEHTSEVEFARLEILDPFGINAMLRQFRYEGVST